jgi:hypothetical protein
MTGEQPILSIRATVPEPEADSFVAEALHDVRVYMQEHDVAPAGPPFSIRRQRGDEVDVEAGWPTAGLLAGTSRIHSGLVPHSLAGRKGVAALREPALP